MRSPLRSVAVFDADSPTAVAFTRSLGRAGVPVTIHAREAWPVARFSRYATSFRRAPDPNEPDAFIPWLTDELKSGRISIVAPTSDAIAFALAETRELFREEVRRALPTRERALDALLKERFHAACARAGVATPWSFAPASIEEARDRARELPYPVILKPKSHIGVGLERGRVVHGQDELVRAFAPYPGLPGSRRVLERMPSLRLPLIQEYIPGALDNLLSVSGLLGPEGRAIAFAGSRKLRQWPPALGIGVAFESAFDADAIDRGVSLAERILGAGIFELEWIRDPRDGSLRAIDLNPRAYGQIALDIARGRDLPLLWYRIALGDDVPVIGAATTALRWFHAIPDAVEHAVAVTRGPNRWQRAKEFVAERTVAHVDVVHDPTDRLPTLRFATVMLRHPGGLLRPFLASG